MSNNSNSRATFSVIGSVILVLAAIMALTFFVNGLDLANYKFFGPKVEQTRRDIFKQSQSYNDGMANTLQGLRHDYMQAQADEAKATTDAQRQIAHAQQQTIRATVEQQFGAYDTSNLPPDLQSFYHQLVN